MQILWPVAIVVKQDIELVQFAGATKYNQICMKHCADDGIDPGCESSTNQMLP